MEGNAVSRRLIGSQSIEFTERLASAYEKYSVHKPTHFVLFVSFVVPRCDWIVGRDAT